jgi:hypothetical protein
MKTLIASLLLSLTVVGQALADAATIIKQRAREANAMERSGEAPAPKPKPAVQAPVQPPAAQLTAAQTENIQSIVADLNAIKPKSAATEIQKEHLRKTLANGIQAAIKPAQASITQFAYALAAAWPDQTLSGAEQTQLARSIHFILNGASLSANVLQAHYDAAQALINKSGFTPTDAKKIVGGLRALVREIQMR